MGDVVKANNVMYYEIYGNKQSLETPSNYLGVVGVEGETDDSLINNWCVKKMGYLYKIHNHKLIKMWNYMRIDDIHNDDKIIITIKRKVK